MNKLDMESKNIVEDNILKLEELFPNIVSEGKIDFDTLKQELSSVVIDEKKEKYQITWPGKKEAIVSSNTPTSNTLRPLKEKSINFDETSNLYIEGDNLEALKILQESYLNKIKLIYIDPPYNTGNDFIYNDKFNKHESDELLDSGIIDDVGNRLISNSSSNGRFHSDWLSMMYPRIKLARNLLKNNGLIFISIDDNEAANLKKMCDEIFGENNFICQLVWRKKYGGGKGTKYFVDMHEYILCYAKRIDSIKKLSIPRTDEQKEIFSLTDEYEAERGKYYIRPLKSGLALRPTLIYPITCPDGSEIETQWICAKDTFEKMKAEGRIVFKQLQDGSYNVYKKFYEKDNEDGVLPESLIYDLAYNQNAKEEIKALFCIKEGREVPFENAKPTKLLNYLLEVAIDNDDEVVMDFFSGSGSFADSVMQYNANPEHHNKLKYICIQLNEKCSEESNAFKQGYNTICEIGEERIKRAAKKIKEETNADIDYGFRVYKIDESNMKDVYYKPNEVEQVNLMELLSNIKEDRTPEDLLTQVMLDLGLTLDLKIEERNISNNKVFYVEDNSLVACFDDKIDINIIDEICKCEPMKVVFKDSAFETDKDKINLEEKIKKLSPDTEVNIL